MESALVFTVFTDKSSGDSRFIGPNNVVVDDAAFDDDDDEAFVLETLLSFFNSIFDR